MKFVIEIDEDFIGDDEQKRAEIYYSILNGIRGTEGAVGLCYGPDEVYDDDDNVVGSIEVYR